MSVGKQVIEPGGKALLQLLLGKDYFNNPNTGGLSGFDLPGSLGVIARMGRGEFSPGPNFDEIVGDQLLKQRVKGWDSGPNGGEFGAWMDNGGTGLGHIYDRQQGADFGSKGGLLFSDLGILGGALRDQRNSGSSMADPSEAIQKLIGQWGNAPDPANWLSAAQRARGGLPAGDAAGRVGVNWALQQAGWNENGPQADPIGQRGVTATQGLTNGYEDDLNRAIDKETNLSLTDDLSSTRNLLAGAGLGESGIGAGTMADTYRRAKEQAIRDKQRTMAGFRESSMGRQAEAINLGTQIGAQEASDKQQRMAQMLLGAMGINASGLESDMGRDFNATMAGMQANENRLASREGVQGDLMSRLLMDRYGSEAALARGRLDLDQMLGIESALSSRRSQEQQAQQWAGQFGQGLWGFTRGLQDSDLDRAIRSNQQMREIRQNQLNHILQAGMMPYDLFSKILTGIQSTPTAAPRTSPWASIGPAVAGNYLSGLMPSAGGSYPGPQYNAAQEPD